MTTENALMQIGKSGAEYAEVFFNSFCELTPKYVKELREICDFYDLSIPSAHPFTCAFEPFLLFTGYERRFQDGLDLYKAYFEAMNLLGSDIFVFHGDRSGSDFEDKRYYERFARLCDLGKEYSITVAQENVDRCKSRSLDFLVGLADYLNGDLSIVFDNKQAIRSGISYEKFISTLGRYIVHAHISDNDTCSECLSPGRGNCDFNEFFTLLQQKGFNGAVIIELYSNRLQSLDEIPQGFEYMRGLMNDGNFYG